jgi:hypothetical protein
MELNLAHEGLWAYVSGSYPRPTVDAVNPSASALKELRLWTIAEGKARANIILACEPGLRSDLMIGPLSKFTSAELWTYLEEKYGKPDPSVMANIRLTLSVRGCPEDSSAAAVEHAAWLQRENNKLLGSTMEFNDLHLAMQLLATLPKSMESVRQSMMSRGLADITFENVRSAIVRFDQSEQSSQTMSRIIGTQGAADTPAAMAATGRPSPPSTPRTAWRCSFHKSNSHSDAQCRSQKEGASKKTPANSPHPSSRVKAGVTGSANSSTASDRKRDDNDSDSDAYFASALRTSTSPIASTPSSAEPTTQHTVWIVDSAATHHFSPSKDCMSKFEPASSRVKLGDDHHLSIAGTGDIRALMQHEDSKPTKVIFKDVRYVPGLAVNLLSVARMAAQGLTTTFSRNRAVIYNPQMEVIAVARLDRTGHYTLTTTPRTNPLTKAATGKKPMALRHVPPVDPKSAKLNPRAVVRGGHNESFASFTTPHIHSISPDVDDDDEASLDEKQDEEKYDGDNPHHHSWAQSDSDSEQDRVPLSNLLAPQSSHVQLARTPPPQPPSQLRDHLSSGPRDTPSATQSSRRQATVAQSSVEAEYMAMAEGAKEAIWWRRFLGELSQRPSSPTPIYVDNTGSISLARNPEHHARTKHIDVKYHLTREHLQRGTIALHHVPTQNNTADVFTKALSRPAHVQHRNELGLTTPA